MRAGSLKDDEASKLFRALRVTAGRFGLELAALPKARRDAKEATDARAALRKRWVATVEKSGPGYRTKRGFEMPDWVTVAYLSSYKVRRTLHRWSIEVPRAIMPNRQRTMHSFYTTAGARLPADPAPSPAQVTGLARPAPRPSRAGEPARTDPRSATKRRPESGVGMSGQTATLPRERRHDISRVPAPWGVAPQQDALRGAITSYDSDGRCSYAATHKCCSSHDRWSRCIVVDHPGVAEQWEDATEEYTSTRERKSLVDLVRCERCAVGVHPACAVDYSEWSGKVGEPRRYFDRRDILRGGLLCYKCFDEYLPYVWTDDPESTANGGTYKPREGELPWWVTDVEL